MHGFTTQPILKGITIYQESNPALEAAASSLKGLTTLSAITISVMAALFTLNRRETTPIKEPIMEAPLSGALVDFLGV